MTYPVTTVGLELITPEKAEEYLLSNIENNRDINHHRVATYTADILSGDWSNNGETIKFDQDGKLIDGQHRLMAIKKANKPVYMWVARGVDGNAFRTVDTGLARTTKQILKMNPSVNPIFLKKNAISTGVMFFSALKRERPSQAQIEKWLESNADLLEWAYSSVTRLYGMTCFYAAIAIIAHINGVSDTDISGFIRGAYWSIFDEAKPATSLKLCVRFESIRKHWNNHLITENLETGLRYLYSYANNLKTASTASNLFSYSMDDTYRIVKG